MKQFQNSLTSSDVVPEKTPFKIKITEGDQRQTYVSSILNELELQQTLEVFKPPLNIAPNSLDYANVYLDDVYIKKGGEDCAPYRIMGTTIGGNHGYYNNLATSVGHGKQDVDIGSVWNNGTEDVTLLSVEDIDRIWLDGVEATGLTYTHVSGATNTASFTVSTRTNSQFYPINDNWELTLKVDGVTKHIETAEYESQNDIVFENNYDILSFSSMIQYLRDNVGTLTRNSFLGGDSMVRVTNKVRYTRFGNTLENTFEVLPSGDGMAFADIMFAMGFEMIETATYPNMRTYIPKALPFNDEGTDFDFANIEPYSADSWSQRINITPDRAIATGIFADRHLYLLDGLGFSMGFLPTGDADPSARRLRCNNKAMQLAVGGKIYMSAIDDNSQSSVTSGQSFGVTAYKQFFESTTNRTAYYIVDADDGGYYLYADWHTLPYIDSLEIPSELRGKTITLIEKSDNVSYTGTQVGATLSVTITDSETYGYLILKL